VTHPNDHTDGQNMLRMSSDFTKHTNIQKVLFNYFYFINMNTNNGMNSNI